METSLGLEQAVDVFLRQQDSQRQKLQQDTVKKLSDKYREQCDDVYKAQTILVSIGEIMAQEQKAEFSKVEKDVIDIAKLKQTYKIIAKSVMTQAIVNQLYNCTSQGNDENDQQTISKQEVLKQLRQDAEKEADKINFDEDDQISQFKRLCWKSLNPNTPFPLDTNDGDIEVDYGQTQREVARNEKCPFTGQNVINLEDPVEDNRGFVYDRSAILTYLTKHGGEQQCPISGANHIVRINDLHKAHGVIHERKRRKLQPTTQIQDTKNVIQVDELLYSNIKMKQERRDQQNNEEE